MIVTDVLGGSGARTRLTDPETSHAAADSSESSVGESHRLVLSILREAWAPLTQEQIVAKARSYPWESLLTPQRIRSAVSELAGKSSKAPQFKERPRVVVADTEGRTRAGRRAQRWRLTGE